ncbi:MAG: PAC2 family protein [Chloroflexi bacterium]|nr:MAG: PAC2 family protein [Chloroflexota bacterium]
MTRALSFWKTPPTDENYMVAGWRQWADAGSTSSGLPQYLIELTGAERIGSIASQDFYLFQLPGTHHLLRPEIKLQQGYRQSLGRHTNEFYYAQCGGKGLVIFLGDEPHLNVDRYAELFLDAVQALAVRRVVAVGGVYGAMPFNKDREISCVYSLPVLKAELEAYAVRFSDYEGGSTIGTFLADRAEAREIEFIDFYAFVPAYDFSSLSPLVSGIRLEADYKAWYDLLHRFNYMFGLGLDLSDLLQQSEALIASVEARLTELDQKMPQLKIREYLQKLTEDFKERPFTPLDDVWEEELGDLLNKLDGDE